MAPADAAVGLCGRCPVAGACLAWALSVGDCHGVWGGTTARERRAMLVAWRTEVQPEEPNHPEDGDVVVSAGELIPAPRRPIHRFEGASERPLLKREATRTVAC